jgi:hypothetical protein
MVGFDGKPYSYDPAEEAAGEEPHTNENGLFVTLLKGEVLSKLLIQSKGFL